MGADLSACNPELMREVSKLAQSISAAEAEAAATLSAAPLPSEVDRRASAAAVIGARRKEAAEGLARVAARVCALQAAEQTTVAARWLEWRAKVEGGVAQQFQGKVSRCRCRCRLFYVVASPPLSCHAFPPLLFLFPSFSSREPA